MQMERGVTLLNMAMFGFRTKWTRDGLRIPRGIGFTRNRGDGHGTTTLPGASLPFTTADGLTMTAAGDGRRDHTMADGIEDITRQRWSRGLVEAVGELASAAEAGELALARVASASVSAAAMDGARWVGENPSFPGITRGGDISETRTFTTHESITLMASAMAFATVSVTASRQAADSTMPT